MVMAVVDFPVRPLRDELRQDPEQPWPRMKVGLPVPSTASTRHFPTVIQGKDQQVITRFGTGAEGPQGNSDKFMVASKRKSTRSLRRNLLAFSHKEGPSRGSPPVNHPSGLRGRRWPILPQISGVRSGGPVIHHDKMVKKALAWGSADE